MQAVLSTTAEDDSAARLADQVNRTVDWALKTAKARPRVEVRSGAYQTYPVYDMNRIRRWRATQELLLEGGDFAELGTLIGQLQERLQVTAMQFTVSPARRAAVEDPEPQGLGHGIGLRSMKERAHLSGGSISIQCRKGIGTTVLVSWHY